MGFSSRGVTGADITAAARFLRYLDVWSSPAASQTVTTAAGDKTLSNVTCPTLTGYTIEKAYAMLNLPSVTNTNAVYNYIDTDQYIQVDKAAAGYINALKIAHTALRIQGTECGHGIIMIGGIDIKTRVASGAVTNFKWTGAKAKENNYIMGTPKTGIRVVFY
jgi:hypothetical protein